MMKRFMILASFCAAVACSSLQAQAPMTANIPFDFELGDQRMPAGEYRVESGQNWLILRAVGRSKAVIVQTMQGSRETVSESVRLEFNRYGNSYFFAGIWTANSRYGAILSKTAREKELAKSAVLKVSTQASLVSH